MKSVWLVLVLVCFAGVVSGATYYVNETGDNSASGDAANPWSDIAPHLFGGPNLLSSGDTLIIRNGTYDEHAVALNGLYTTIDNISIVGESQEGVVVNFVTNATNGFYSDDAGVSVYNLTVVNNLTNGRCFYIRDESANFEIKNVRCENAAYGIYVYFNTGNATNVTISDNTFFNNTYVISGSFSGKLWDNASFVDNEIVNCTSYVVSGVDGYNLNNRLTIENNTYTDLEVLELEFQSAVYDYTNNDFFGLKRLYLRNINDYVFEDIELNHYGTSGSENYYALYLNNVSNLIIDNLTTCSEDNKCYFGDFGIYHPHVIYSVSSDNITLRNSNFYFHNSSEARMVYGNFNNSLFENNYFNTTMDSGFVIAILGDNNTIKNNTAHVYNNSISYLFGCGTEVLPVGGRYENCTIRDNIGYADYDNVSTTLHSVFLGYTNNSLVSNNTIYGGGYGHVIKGNTNSIIENGSIYGYPRNLNLYEKGGANNIFRNYYIESDGSAIWMNKNSEDNFSVSNSTYENITISCKSGESCLVRLADNTTTSFYDVLGYSDFNILSEANVSIYYSLEVSGQSGVSFTITDNQSNEYDYDTDSYSTTYFLAGEENSTTYTNYSNFEYSASKYGQTHTGSFILSEPYTLTLPTFTEAVEESSGGGSSSAAPIYRPSEEKLVSGYEVSLGKNYKVNFEVGGSSHSLTVDGIYSDYVKVTIQSDPVVLELKVGDVRRVDLDGDGVYDLEVELKELSVSRADLILRTISEVGEEATNYTNYTNGDVEVVTNVNGDEDSWIWDSWILVVLIVVLVFLVFWKRDLLKKFFKR